ncbi:universal stress protein [Pseudomonas sp. CC6-YY-74]|uniref:universal stress protein n=1 Tax=Pseudomonas sp. CC6-YY-74 TaxID=1930532 RepID=UPI0009A1F7BB|nr:universal stress protein [Pseudomonas sp. CC6-YY-74]
MHSIRRILVVLNPEQPDSLPLRRAKHIATGIHAEIHLVLCDNQREHAPFLRHLSKQLSGEGFVVSTQQINCDHSQPTDAILTTLQTHSCDLLIKQHYPDSLWTKHLVIPEDWRLLRQSPVPVLLTKTARPWNGGRVLAAMDIENAENQHRDLQGSIMGHAVDLAALIGGSTHAVSAYPATLFSAADSSAPRYDGQAAHCLEASRWFKEEYQLHDYQLHIGEGPAKALILQIAHQLEIAVTVIGTVARNGLAGMLIGNTAEAILDRLDSDLLVLKPHDHAVHLLEPYEEFQQAPSEAIHRVSQ